MTEEEINALLALLDERTVRLMERESELADKFEELGAQKEELAAALDQLIKNNEDLNIRNQELDLILYRSSHDLKSPLSSMLGLLNLLKVQESNTELHALSFHFEQQLRQMNNVINTLILLGESVLGEVKITKINLIEALDEEIEQLQYLPNYKNVIIEKTLSNCENVITDSLLIRILIRCLVSNAIIFRDQQNGSIEIDIKAERDQLHMWIKDDGDGIEKEVEPRIWDMFYRGSERSLGHGMGLYIVKRIVQRLEGDVKYYRENLKTVFEVSIPLFPPPSL